jgi:RNA polymerase sigma-70 factor (ECF subfamily)
VNDVETAVGDAFHTEWGRIVAALIGRTGDWDLAEECAQEAFAQALVSWASDGVPERPGAWLTAVARNRAFDRLRRRANETRKLREVAALSVHVNTVAPVEVVDVEEIPDERLSLIFTCCHPALALEGRAALTLRTLAGLTTAEIAQAFLVSEATMAKRLVRAKQKIQRAGIPYRIPPRHLLAERTAGVLAVVYLLFNEGYGASSGAELLRVDLSAEAIRLGRVLVALMPEEPEVLGLLALLVLTDARRAARLNDDGDIVTLEEQNRAQWDGALIREGVRLIGAAGPLASAGPYQLQAAISACHADPEATNTDWAAISRLYEQLAQVMPSPVVTLNRAVADGMAYGPEAGLAWLDELDAQGSLSEYHLLPATRADLLRRLGLRDAAAVSYRQALTLAPTAPEQRFLQRRLREMESPLLAQREAES